MTSASRPVVVHCFKASRQRYSTKSVADVQAHDHVLYEQFDIRGER